MINADRHTKAKGYVLRGFGSFMERSKKPLKSTPILHHKMQNVRKHLFVFVHVLRNAGNAQAKFHTTMYSIQYKSAFLTHYICASSLVSLSLVVTN